MEAATEIDESAATGQRFAGCQQSAAHRGALRQKRLLMQFRPHLDADDLV